MAKNFVYTDLRTKGALTLTIRDVVYEVAQYSSSWACNEIPTASCMLAIGRESRTGVAATVHTHAQFTQMEKAVVRFTPRGEYNREGDWPCTTEIIFEGFFVGFAFRKISGKVHAIASLVHWLAALGMSSCLTKNGHVNNPTQLNAAAVINSLLDTGAARGNYISALAPFQLISDNIENDVWAAIKTIFCALANIEVLPLGLTDACGGSGDASINDFALPYLSRIEGFITPSPARIPLPGVAPAATLIPNACSLAYHWGVPLKMETYNVTRLADAVAMSIADETVASYANVSFWDKLVGQFCPMFGMAIVPMVDTAIVIADTPVLSTDGWAVLEAEDYDALEMTAELHRPLRSVGVMAMGEGGTMSGVELRDVLQGIGGCYAEDSVAPGDGTVLFVSAPYWLRSLRTLPFYSSITQGLHNGVPIRTTTTPGGIILRPPDQPGALGTLVNKLYENYAHEVYVNQMLRGRDGILSGKLRFDIAPGSIIQLNGTPEQFIGPGQDDLGVTMFGCVQRVTIAINAEAGMAGTTFKLSHTRTSAENQLPRTSVTEHPLFGNSIHGDGLHGCPLKDIYNLD